MNMGISQIFQHIAVWSQVPLSLTHMSPLEAASLAGSPKASIGILNTYLREARLQEIGLTKALGIDPDRLQTHLERKGAFSRYFLNLQPRPAWMSAHPQPTLAIDDLHQLRMSISGAKDRVTKWSKRPSSPRPAGLEEHLRWLQEILRSRSDFARLAVQFGEPEAGIGYFYDAKRRANEGLTQMEESLKVYFQVSRHPA